MGSDTNLVTTIIGFGLSATFIVFVCTRIICGRIRGRVGSRSMYELESRADIERAEYHANDPEPAFVAAIPTLNFNPEAFSSIECTQCVICLAEYKDKELLRIIPHCGHTFHLSCIDIWLRKQSTCPVCRLPLHNVSETKHVMRPVTFTINQSLSESNTSERNTGNERQDEPNASNSIQITSEEPEARQ
ncbi:Zinc finger, RING-type [Sesbania bispinosa]|nr:Zinc finger, RING-type [Sesbania bispinosa]